MNSLKNRLDTYDEGIILNYKNTNEVKFFEYNTYDDKNLPKWGEIQFLLNNKKLAHKLNFDEAYERTGSDDTKEVPFYIWKALKKLVFFNEEGQEPQNMRDEIKNKEFIELIEQEKIKKFEDFEYSQGESLIEATKRLNINSYSSLFEYLCKGKNKGNCGMTSKLFMLLYGDKIELHEGYMKEMEGTINSPKGQHAWLELGGYIFDTSLLLVIPKRYKEELGYKTNKKLINGKEIEKKITKGELIDICKKSPVDVEEVFYSNYLNRELEVREGYFNKDEKGEYIFPREIKASYNEYVRNGKKLLEREHTEKEK